MQSIGCADGARRGFQRGPHGRKAPLIRMPQVDGEANAPGDGVARVGVDVELADGRTCAGQMLAADAMDGLHDAGGGEQRIPPGLHRRRPGMGLPAGDDEVEPALALCAGHHADGLSSLFQDRALLDVEFEVRRELFRRYPIRSAVADPAQLLAEAAPLRVGGRRDGPRVELARKHPGAHHRRGEAAALLVRPGHDFDRAFGRPAEIVEGAHHLERRDYAVCAVELAAGGLRVEMAAGKDRPASGVPAGPAGVDVAGRVDADGAAGFPAPGDEQVARLAVQVGERLPVDPSPCRGADARHAHDTFPQPVGIDPHGYDYPLQGFL